MKKPAKSADFVSKIKMALFVTNASKGQADQGEPSALRTRSHQQEASDIAVIDRVLVKTALIGENAADSNYIKRNFNKGK